MTWDVVVFSILKSLFLPPGINIGLFVTCIILLKKFRQIAYLLLAVSIISLLVLSTPKIANHLTQFIEPPAAIDASQIKILRNTVEPQRAIVVLSGGRVSISPEYGEIDTVNAHTLQRLQYASWLQKKTQLPVLLSGGSVLGEATSEAVLMNQVMMASFSAIPKWIESESKNTLENAEFSAKILQQHNISEIVLVTHAWHMRRAETAFEEQGLTVIAAATGFQSRNKRKENWLLYLPDAAALHKSSRALNEILGELYYSL